MKAMNSHVYGLKYKEIAVTMEFKHLFAASLWIGGFSASIPLLSKDHKNGKWTLYWDAIKRFSPWVICAVIIIVVTGLFNSRFFIPTIDSFYYSIARYMYICIAS
ncbi:copper transport protein [Bacillus sp. 166amftsu]|nr:copper transport protein [Bacillus sp. 166amftsu]